MDIQAPPGFLQQNLFKILGTAVSLIGVIALSIMAIRTDPDKVTEKEIWRAKAQIAADTGAYPGDWHAPKQPLVRELIQSNVQQGARQQTTHSAAPQVTRRTLEKVKIVAFCGTDDAVWMGINMAGTNTFGSGQGFTLGNIGICAKVQFADDIRTLEGIEYSILALPDPRFLKPRGQNRFPMCNNGIPGLEDSSNAQCLKFVNDHKGETLWVTVRGELTVQ